MKPESELWQWESIKKETISHDPKYTTLGVKHGGSSVGMGAYGCQWNGLIAVHMIIMEQLFSF